MRESREKEPGPSTPDPSSADRKSVPPADASRASFSGPGERRVSHSGRGPTGGRESGGASADRWEAASAERPEARERRSRRKRGPAPDPEARPSEASRREAENVLAGCGRRCALLRCGEAAVAEVAHPGRPEPRTALCERHARRARKLRRDQQAQFPLPDPALSERSDQAAYQRQSQDFYSNRGGER